MSKQSTSLNAVNGGMITGFAVLVVFCFEGYNIVYTVTVVITGNKFSPETVRSNISLCLSLSLSLSLTHTHTHTHTYIYTLHNVFGMIMSL